MSINISDLSTMLKAIKRCREYSCENCRKSFDVTRCPLTIKENVQAAEEAYKAIDKYIDLSKPRITVDETEFLSLLFTDGDFSAV